jgi:hypothetical protein
LQRVAAGKIAERGVSHGGSDESSSNPAPHRSDRARRR